MGSFVKAREVAAVLQHNHDQFSIAEHDRMVTPCNRQQVGMKIPNDSVLEQIFHFIRVVKMMERGFKKILFALEMPEQRFLAISCQFGDLLRRDAVVSFLGHQFDGGCHELESGVRFDMSSHETIPLPNRHDSQWLLTSSIKMMRIVVKEMISIWVYMGKSRFVTGNAIMLSSHVQATIPDGMTIFARCASDDSFK